MTRVLISGVCGKTGVPLANLLATRPGVDVLGGSSDPTSVALDGVISTPFSWDDRSGRQRSPCPAPPRCSPTCWTGRSATWRS